MVYHARDGGAGCLCGNESEHRPVFMQHLFCNFWILPEDGTNSWSKCQYLMHALKSKDRFLYLIKSNGYKHYRCSISFFTLQTVALGGCRQSLIDTRYRFIVNNTFAAVSTPWKKVTTNIIIRPCGASLDLRENFGLTWHWNAVWWPRFGSRKYSMIRTAGGYGSKTSQSGGLEFGIRAYLRREIFKSVSANRAKKKKG